MPEQLDRFIKKGALTPLSFTDADLQLKLRRVAIELSGAFISPQAELHPSGQVGLNAELNMQAQLKLATDVFSSDTKIADYLPREGSWVVLPVVIKGTLDNPSVTLSDEALRHIMQVTLPRLFMDMLEKAKREEAKPEKARAEKARPEEARSSKKSSPKKLQNLKTRMTARKSRAGVNVIRKRRSKYIFQSFHGRQQAPYRA